MKTLSLLVGLTALWLCACTPSEAIVIPPSSPILLRPEHIFATPDITLAWEYAPLSASERFVFRLWYEEQPFVEVWTTENSLDAETIINTFSRDFGYFYWQVAVADTNEDGSFKALKSEWSATGQLERLRRLPISPVAEDERTTLTQFVSTIGAKDTHELIALTNQFIVENADLGAEGAYLPDYRDAAEQVMAFSQGLQSTAPTMYCNDISTLMLVTLQQLGIESRLIFLYGEVSGYISQHTILEVFIPETQVWQAYDPTSNAYLWFPDEEKIPSVADVAFSNEEKLQACTYDGTCTSDYGFKHLYDGFRYGYTETFYVNPSRMNVANMFDFYDNFPEKLMFDPRGSVFKFDRYERP